MAAFTFKNEIPRVFQAGYYDISSRLYYIKKGPESNAAWIYSYYEERVHPDIGNGGRFALGEGGLGGANLPRDDDKAGNTVYQIDAGFLWPAGVGPNAYSGYTYLFISTTKANNSYQWVALDSDKQLVYKGKWDQQKGKCVLPGGCSDAGVAEGRDVNNPFYPLYNNCL